MTRKRIRLTGDEKVLFEKLKNTMSHAKAKEFRYEIRDYRNFIREANKKSRMTNFLATSAKVIVLILIQLITMPYLRTDYQESKHS